MYSLITSDWIPLLSPTSSAASTRWFQSSIISQDKQSTNSHSSLNVIQTNCTSVFSASKTLFIFLHAWSFNIFKSHARLHAALRFCSNAITRSHYRCYPVLEKWKILVRYWIESNISKHCFAEKNWNRNECVLWKHLTKIADLLLQENSRFIQIITNYIHCPYFTVAFWDFNIDFLSLWSLSQLVCFIKINFPFSNSTKVYFG